MKKYSLILCLLLAVLVLAGCQEEEIMYTALQVEHVTVIQNSAESYTVTVTLEDTAEEGRVFFTRYDKLRQQDTPIDAEKSGNSYTFTANVPTGEYYVWVKTDTAIAMMNVSIPEMSPYVTVAEAAGGGQYAQLFYEIDGGSSWSSFVDPEGKNVYKSAKNTFDDTAVPAAQNISILDGSSTDPSYSEDMPYYYVVFEGKNGMLTFVSYPLVEENRLFSGVSVGLEELEAKPMLRVDLTLGPDTRSGRYRLVVKSPTTGETYRGDPVTPENGSARLTLDVSALERSGVWYDIAIEDVAMGRLINLRSEMSDGSFLVDDGRNYHFKEWEGILKLNFDMVLTAYTVESATLTPGSDGRPMLTVSGTCTGDPDALQLAIRYEAGGEDKATVELVQNTAAEEGRFLFVFDASQLTAMETWHDIDILFNGTYYTLYDTVADMDQEVVYNDRTYLFKEWSHNLKISMEPGITASKNSNDTVFVEWKDGKPILVVTGSVGFSQNPSLDRTVTLELREDRLPGGKIVCQNLSADPDTRVYRFEADLSLLTENGLGNGDWVDLFLLLTEGDRTYEGDLRKDDVVCDSNAPSLSTGYRRYYFEKWGNYLKVVTSPDENIKESNIFLNSTDSVRLEQAGEDVYLILQGTAYISNSKLDVFRRTVRLKADGGLYFENQYEGDDSAGYYFKIRLNDYKNVVAGLRIEVTEILSEGAAPLTRDCEIKQAAWDDPAGSLVPKPAGGMTAVLTPCGVYTAGGQVYSLIVDEWNNIKLRAASQKTVTLSPLKTDADIWLEKRTGEKGERLYLIIRGTAHIDKEAESRIIRLAVGLDPKDFVYENLEKAGDTAFRFEVDVTGFGISDDWYKFKVQVTEGDTALAAEFPQGTYTGPLTDSAAQWVEINGKRIGIKYEWNQVYLKVEVAS